MATNYDVFEKAERIEALCAEVYRLLAAQFAADAGARELFSLLQEEELQHATRVRLLAARYRHDTRLLGAQVGPPELDQMLAEVQETQREIEQGSFASTVQQARARLTLMEDRFVHAHAELIAGAGHPALREFFRQLAEQDRGHQELLRG